MLSALFFAYRADFGIVLSGSDAYEMRMADINKPTSGLDA